MKLSLWIPALGVVAIAGLGAATASAVTINPLLRIGDSTSAGTVTAVGGVSINQVGGFSVGFSTASTDAFFGSATGTSPGVLLQEGNIGGEIIVSFLTNVGGIANDGTVAWRGANNNASDSSVLGFGSTIIARDGNPKGDAIPAIPGANYNVPGNPAVSATGGNVWLSGSYYPSGSGTSNGSGVFSNGGNAVPLNFSGNYLTSTTVAPGLNVKQNIAGLKVSPNGSNFIATTAVQTGLTSDDDVLVVNGSVPSPAGTLLKQAQVVPIALGGDGTVTWSTFSSSTGSVNDSGSYFFSGGLGNASASSDGYLALDGLILLREGAVLSGATLTGNPQSGALNNQGNWAAVWNTDLGQALIVDGQLLLKVGDSIGTYGTLTSFTSTGANMLQVGPANSPFDVYFRATTSLGGDGIYMLTVPEPASLGLLALGAVCLAGRSRRTSRRA